MTKESLPKRLIDVLISRLAASKVRMKKRFLLPGVGFGLKRLPPTLERGAIRSDNPGPAGHDAGAIVGEQIV